MSWNRACSIVLSVSMLVFAGIALTGATRSTKKAAGRPNAVAQLARGKYLVTVMGCGDCHTPGTLFGAPDFTRMLSGSELGWQGPWGVTYARNLTPDMETGLGKWSAQEIATAFRSGHRPDGSMLLPPMPWQTFSALTDADAQAMAVYLKSIPAVAHKVPDRAAPGAQVSGSILVFPPPSEWDAPRGAAPDSMVHH